MRCGQQAGAVASSYTGKVKQSGDTVSMNFSLPWITLVRFVVWLAIGLAIYFLYSRRRSFLGPDTEASAGLVGGEHVEASPRPLPPGHPTDAEEPDSAEQAQPQAPVS
jgi:hypothetical protein